MGGGGEVSEGICLRAAQFWSTGDPVDQAAAGTARSPNQKFCRILDFK
jgi:hypothetical protein